MDRLEKLSWIAVGLACLGAVLQPGPLWLFLPPIFASLLCSGFVMLMWQRRWADFQEAAELQDKWRLQRERCR